jgi:HSP20 family protein
MNGRTVTRWHPAYRLRGEMERLMEDVFSDFFGREWTPDEFAFRGRGMPALNVWEDEQNLYAEAEVPGLTMDDLDLTVVGGELTIRGERKGFEQEGVVHHRREREVGTFSRVVRLPVEVDVDRVQANLEHGVLRITLPKSAGARPRKIEVKSATK